MGVKNVCVYSRNSLESSVIKIIFCTEHHQDEINVKKTKKQKKTKKKNTHQKTCDQKRLRSACTSTQYGKYFCVYLFG